MLDKETILEVRGADFKFTDSGIPDHLIYIKQQLKANQVKQAFDIYNEEQSKKDGETPIDVSALLAYSKQDVNAPYYLSEEDLSAYQRTDNDFKVAQQRYE